MSKWDNLPKEPQVMIFRYLKPKYTKPKKKHRDYITHDSKDIISCQLVCKGWEEMARNVLYENVVLEDQKQLIKFHDMIKTTENSKLIHKLDFVLEETTGILKPIFNSIAIRCQNLKSITMKYPNRDIIKTINHNRLKKKFMNLEEIPDIVRFSPKNIRVYNNCALQLQKSLCKLTIYDVEQNNLPIENFERAKELKFVLTGTPQLAHIDNFLQKSSIVETVRVRFACKYKKDSFQYTRAIPSPKVKKLYIEKVAPGDRAGNFIKEVFPNLENDPFLRK